jgi:ABC-type transport system substrate-binding protein
VSAACASSTPTAAQGPAAQGSAAVGATTIPLLREGTTYTFSNLTEQYADGLPEANWSEHLVRVGPTGQIEPWLAQSVTQSSPTVRVGLGRQQPGRVQLTRGEQPARQG